MSNNPWVCIACRRVWRSGSACPECGQPGIRQSSRWRAPRRSNDVGWKRVAAGDWLWDKPHMVPVVPADPRPYDVTRQAKDELTARLAALGAGASFGTVGSPRFGRRLLITIDARTVQARHNQALLDTLVTCPTEDSAQVDLVNMPLGLEDLLRDAATIFDKGVRHHPIAHRNAVRIHFTAAPTTARGWSSRLTSDKKARIYSSRWPGLVLLPHTATADAS